VFPKLLLLFWQI